MNIKKRIILADDHALVIVGMKHILNRNPDYEVVAEARSPDELIEKIQHFRPDAVITDYNMPVSSRYGDGIRLMTYIKNNFPEIRLFVLTMISSPLIASSLYSLGVEGVFLKDSDLDALESAILSVLRRDKPRKGPKLSKRIAGVDERVSELTPKEMEIMRYLFCGMSVSAIAAQLHRSITTVSAHKISAMRKLGAENDHELIMFCMEHGLFTS